MPGSLLRRVTAGAVMAAGMAAMAAGAGGAAGAHRLTAEERRGGRAVASRSRARTGQVRAGGHCATAVTAEASAVTDSDAA